jgi:hypothetical protein
MLLKYNIIPMIKINKQKTTKIYTVPNQIWILRHNLDAKKIHQIQSPGAEEKYPWLGPGV